MVKTNETKIGSPSSKTKSPDIHNITSKVNIMGSYNVDANADVATKPEFRVS